ncbi:hypothetical protein KJ657_04090 [Patescibacteria group bacterium]|nr:hypothetical protein [Patescibacteria group bacterium]MBU1016245.1 hypothetical protein [Patescibacteria group bacterium]MBU1685477.1 hypothetical protein [Patescibacteria group bacterium]MBU1939103.1 hypothetical protein [Patescibacteria group bacterium]
MKTPDRTPQELKIRVPQPPDSDSGKPIVLDSEAIQPYVAKSSRHRVGRVLVFGATLAVATVGPDIKNVIIDQQRDQVRVAIAEAEKERPPISLQSAQSKAAYKLFGIRGDKNAVKTAQEIVRSPGQSDILMVENYVPEHVQVSEDGETFKTEGQDYGISRVVGQDGSEYLVASKSVIHKGLFGRQENYAASPLLVGGAHNDLSSDINQDGVVTPEEVREVADESARENLWKSLTEKRVVIDENGAHVISEK